MEGRCLKQRESHKPSPEGAKAQLVWRTETPRGQISGGRGGAGNTPEQLWLVQSFADHFPWETPPYEWWPIPSCHGGMP